MHDTQTQSKILLAALQSRGRITTLQCRTELDILHPAARIQTLREEGHDIKTERRFDATGQKSRHYVGEYVFCGSAQ